MNIDVGSNYHLVMQVVDEIYDKFAASKMGIEETGQVIITLLPLSDLPIMAFAPMSPVFPSPLQVVLMIHCGSRGFGHQVATDALVSMEKAMKRDNIEVALMFCQ